MDKSPDPIDIYVGSRVRVRRLMRDLSQTQLADAIGVAFQQVQKYEKGTTEYVPAACSRWRAYYRYLLPFFSKVCQPI
jgi:transcriptional regulator with XRE-family HTH domain